MTEAIKKLIGKDCLIYLLNGQVSGIIKEVNENSVTVETKGELQIINIDFIMRVREYPVGKNGKKKTCILD